MPASLEGRVRELLEAPNFGHVGTVRKDGSPMVKPIWLDVENGHIVVNSARGRVWPKNVERDPRVSVTVTNPENPYEYVEIRGRVVDSYDDDEVIDRLAKKYLDADKYPFKQAGEIRVTYRIEPEHVYHHDPNH